MPPGNHTGQDLSFGPVEMVVLQGTPFCNLNCSYCYLSEESRRNKATMPVSRIQSIFEKILPSRYVNDSLRVSWHSGEPLVLKPSYYRDAIQAILKAKESMSLTDLKVDFDIQTNGTLISDEWCEFINEMDGLLTIGVSSDGPSFLHDEHRKNWSGKSTHHLTHAGMKRLCDNNIKFDVTAVVSRESLDHPVEFLNYFSRFSDHIREFHFNLHDELFIDIGEKGEIDEYAKKYDFFLDSLLRVIGSDDTMKFPRIRNFSSFYNRLFIGEDQKPEYDARSMCKPFKSLSIEVNGDLTTFYAGLTTDECRDLKNLYGDGKGLVVGNVLNESLDEIASSIKLQKIAGDFETSHSACEAGCEYYNLCSGGYNLIKYRRFSSFDATETPECYVHVKTFANRLLNDLDKSLEA